MPIFFLIILVAKTWCLLGISLVLIASSTGMKKCDVLQEKIEVIKENRCCRHFIHVIYGSFLFNILDLLSVAENNQGN